MKKLNYILIFVLLCVLNMKAEPSSGDNVIYLAKVEVEGSPAIIDLNVNRKGTRLSHLFTTKYIHLGNRLTE